MAADKMVGKRWHPAVPSSSLLATKAAQRERKSQKALKKREARRRKKEKDARAAVERSAEIQARWGVADKAGKENDGVWPACEK